jgi:hypothetical protein
MTIRIRIVVTAGDECDDGVLGAACSRNVQQRHTAVKQTNRQM